MISGYARISICAVIVSISVAGCGDKVIFPVKVKTSANSFRLSEAQWGGQITEVKVWTGGEDRYLVWEIRPVSDIPVRGFVVTAGVVPDGFEQRIPLPPQRFVPIPGEEYVIGVDGDYRPKAWPIATTWTAD